MIAVNHSSVYSLYLRTTINDISYITLSANIVENYIIFIFYYFKIVN